MTRAAFFCDDERSICRVFTEGRKERIARLCELHPTVVTPENIAAELRRLRNLEVIFSTWNMWPLGDDELSMLPNLQAVFHAAGTVCKFAEPFLDRGVRIVSGWGANAVPVAEFTLGQILLANKNYFQNARDCSRPETRSGASGGTGNFEETVSLLGAGMVGTAVIELLRPFRLDILVFDPFLTSSAATELGVEVVDLETAFRRGKVVSNHLANKSQTERMIRGGHFESLRPGATFINTGRGATVAEDEMIEVLHRRPDLTALLDVTLPEPPTTESALYELPNVFLSNHLAGSANKETVRLADCIIEEFEAWRSGNALRFEVTEDMLEWMA